MVAPFVLLAAVTVGAPGAQVRAECEARSEVRATLLAGQPVEVRFALAGSAGNCYKIAATVGGAVVSGYVLASELSGLDDLDRERRSAPALQGGRSNDAAAKPALNWRSSDPRVAQAAKYLDENQPSRASELLEQVVREYPRSPDALAMAGFAAWRADDPQVALERLKTAVALSPNPEIEALYRKIERETTSDRSGDRLVGLRILLRYDPASLPVAEARAMLAMLDAEASRVSQALGCSAQERLVAIVQSRESYLKSTGAAEWSAAQYDGRVHIGAPRPGSDVAALRSSAAHEIVHACLSNMGQFPAWLHEGLAQKLSGRSFDADQRQAAVQLARKAGLGRLETLPSSWNSLTTEKAAAAYAVALAAAEVLMDSSRDYGLRNLLLNGDALAQATAEINRRLGL